MANKQPVNDGQDERDRLNKLARERRQSVQEIGPLPPVADPARREACSFDLRLYLETYLKNRFFWPWSKNHRTAIQTMQDCCIDGGLYALAFPRADGKTTIAEGAVLWAVMNAWRLYALIIAANEKPLAVKILESIKTELETNELLLADYPEICFPIRKLERQPNRAKGQTLNGRPTRIEFTKEGIRLPTVEGSGCSGSIIEVVGMSGAIRGRKALRADGTPMRPDLIIPDDPQTRESSKSPTQTADRLSIIRGDVLGLAGPNVPIAVVMPCTVIYPNDLADQSLDRDKNPTWNGTRTKRLETFPTNMDLWDEYSRVRADGFRAGDHGKAGNEFYTKNREAMDAGAVVSWPDRIKRGDVSSIQGAMNRYIDNPREFFAEDQNAPLSDSLTSPRELDAGELAKRLSNVPRGEVPKEATRLVSFIDVGGTCLWWGVLALDERYSGSLIDYGPFPPQNRPFFEASDARPSLAEMFPGYSEPQRVYAAIKALTSQLLGRAYPRHLAGGDVRIERLLIDSGWQADTVHQAVRESPFAPMIMPSKGYASESNSRPMNEWTRKPGEKVGWNWRISSLASAGRSRLVLFDPNIWKSFMADRLTTPPGGPGSVQFFGDKASAHEMLAAHLTAEYSTPVTARGRQFDKWSLRPDRRDNHLLDVLTGCFVCASTLGLVWSEASGAAPIEQPAEKPLKYSDVRGTNGQRLSAPTTTPAATTTPGTPAPLTYKQQREKIGLAPRR